MNTKEKEKVEIEKRRTTEKRMMRFLRKKSREPRGGKFFKVRLKNGEEFTLWGRSKKEVSEWLNKKRLHFVELTELVDSHKEN